jgi:hypothetical protein
LCHSLPFRIASRKVPPYTDTNHAAQYVSQPYSRMMRVLWVNKCMVVILPSIGTSKSLDETIASY